MPKPRKIAETDVDWFKARLRDRKLSLRSAAKLAEMDPSAFHHMIHGRRKMTVAEASGLARVLGVPRDDVLRKAGAGMPVSEETSRAIYMLHADGHATKRADGPALPAPRNSSADTFAIRCEDPAAARFGRVYFADPSEGSPRDHLN